MFNEKGGKTRYIFARGTFINRNINYRESFRCREQWGSCTTSRARGHSPDRRYSVRLRALNSNCCWNWVTVHNSSLSMKSIHLHFAKAQRRKFRRKFCNVLSLSLSLSLCSRAVHEFSAFYPQKSVFSLPAPPKLEYLFFSVGTRIARWKYFERCSVNLINRIELVINAVKFVQRRKPRY